MNDRPDASAFTLASSYSPRPVDWFWPGYLPAGTPALLDGDPGLGKSGLIYDLVARVTVGADMPDGSPGGPASKVIIASAEDDPETVIVPRLVAAGADVSNVVFAPMDGTLVLDPGWLALLEALIDEHRATLVTIDPLMAYLPDRTDSNNDASVRRVLAKVAAVARRTRASILCVRHFNKADDMSALHRGGGSIGIIGAARAAYVFVADPASPENGRILAPVKMNVAPKPPALALRITTTPTDYGDQPTLVWLGPVDVNVDDLVRSAGRKAPELRRAEAFVVETLEANEVDTAELERLARQQGISKATLQRARDSLGVVSRRKGFGPGGVHACSLPHPPYVSDHDEQPEIDR